MGAREKRYDTQVLFRTEKHPSVTAATWAVTDRAGFGAIEFIVLKGICTATTARVLVSLQSGTATSAHTTCTTSEMIGPQSCTLAGTLAVACRFSYMGPDRYASIKVDPTQTNVTGCLTVIALRASPIKQAQTGAGTSTKGFNTTFPATNGTPAI